MESSCFFALRLMRLGLLTTSLCLSSLETFSQNAIDTITFGNSTSETAHSFTGYFTVTHTNNSVAPAQIARRCTPVAASNIYGGTLTFNLNVDSTRRNYFSVKFWGGDDYSAVTGQGSDMGRLYLYLPASQFTPGATNNYQVGYRHEGDYICLNVSSYKQPLPGRFFYSTTLLPLWTTQGRTNLTFKIVSTGRVYPLGSSGTPATGNNYQFFMTTNSRSIYSAYTHVDPVLIPSGEVQGVAPATTVRPSPTVSTLSPGGTFYNGISNYLSGRMNASASSLTTVDLMQLAKAYSISNFPVSYNNPALVIKVIAGADYYASNYYANPSSVNGWGGNFGNIGWAIHLLLPQIQSSLDITNNYGSGGNVSRRQAWGDMLLASREYGRFNRNTLSNQGLISGSSIYWANRGLLDLTNASAFPEDEGQRYLKEAIGILPWSGSDLAGGGSDYRFGTNYLQVTPKGLSREWGYVGVAYGEMQFYAADFYSWTTNPAFLTQAVKMAKARANFRRPSMELSGASYYRNMEGIGLLAWRGANESDGDYADETAYGDRTGWALGLRCAAVTMDTNLIGYARQMLADNQYFNSITASGSAYSTIGNQGDSRDALDVFNDYKAVANTPDSGVRLSMTDGQPDFVWADELSGIVAIKHGSERLWVAPYWQAKTGSGVNGIGRFYFSTTNYDQYGVLETAPQFDFSGSFYVRPNYMDKPEQNFYVPPDNPMNAYAGERLPLAAAPAEASDPTPFQGKCRFYAFRYGNYLVGMNASANQSIELKLPSDFTSATNVATGFAVTAPVMVGPTSTVVLYLPNAIDPCDRPSAPLALNASGDSTPRIKLDWNPSSGATAYNVKRATSSGGPYTTIASGVAGTNYTDTSVTRGAAYFYVVSGMNDCGESDYNSMEIAASGGLPAPWIDVDVGSVGTVGNASYDNGTFTVQGGGSDIGGTSDSFHFAYLSMTNSSSITVRLASQTLGKVGVMIRDSTAANSRMAITIIDRTSNKARFAARTSAGGSPTWYDSASTVSTPEWLRLTRSGNTFTGYYSVDGATWIPLGTNTFTMNSTLLVGLAANSRNTSQLTVGTFDNVTTSTWTPPPVAPLNLTATASNSAAILNWNSSTNATGYNLKRAQVSGGPYATVASLSGTNWTDSSVSNGTAYHYVVTATNAAGESAVSAEASATPLPPVPSTPTGLSAVAGDALVTLSWGDVVGATGYSVKRSLVSGGTYNSIGSVGATNFADASVANGTRYFYVVAATNIAGESSFSAEVDGRPVSLSLPQVASSVAANQLQLSWPSDHTGWRLQAQTNSAGAGLGANWVTIPDSTGTNQSLISIDPANPGVFFRLVYP